MYSSIESTNQVDSSLSNALCVCKDLIKASNVSSVLEEVYPISECAIPSYDYSCIVSGISSYLESNNMVPEDLYYKGITLFDDMTGIKITKRYEELDEMYFIQMISLLNISK